MRCWLLFPMLAACSGSPGGTGVIGVGSEGGAPAMVDSRDVSPEAGVCCSADQTATGVAASCSCIVDGSCLEHCLLTGIACIQEHANLDAAGPVGGDPWYIAMCLVDPSTTGSVFGSAMTACNSAPAFDQCLSGFNSCRRSCPAPCVDYTIESTTVAICP